MLLARELWHYLGDCPAELLKLPQGPGRVRGATGGRPHVACEQGLAGVQQSAGLPRQPLQPAAGGVEARPGF